MEEIRPTGFDYFRRLVFFLGDWVFVVLGDWVFVFLLLWLTIKRLMAGDWFFSFSFSGLISGDWMVY
jgi:hypothetical protein